MHTNKRLWQIKLVVLITLLIVLYPIIIQAASPKRYEWDFLSFVPNSTRMGAFLVDFAKAVKERTGGQLDISVKPVGELPYKATDAFRVTSDGSVQIADANTAYISGDSKISGITTLPFLMTTDEDCLKTIDTLLQYFEKELKGKNVEVLFWYTYPSQHLWGKGKPVTNLKELKGRKIRSQSAEIAELLTRLGAATVTLSSAEVSPAMQRGVADGLLTSSSSMHQLKWYEFTDWGYQISTGVALDWILINSNALAQLPADLRAILKKTSKEWQDKMFTEIRQIDNDALKSLEKEIRMKIIYPSKEDQKQGEALMSSYWDSWGKKAGPNVEEAVLKIRKILNK